MSSKLDLERLDDLAMAAWDNHKPQAFVELFADQTVLRDRALAEPIHTRDELFAYMESWLTAFPDMRVRTMNRVVGEESVAAEIEFTGTSTGPLTLGGMAIPATGRSVVGHAAYFVKVEGGRIAEFSAHPDAAELMVQLGLIPRG